MSLPPRIDASECLAANMSCDARLQVLKAVCDCGGEAHIPSEDVDAHALTQAGHGEKLQAFSKKGKQKGRPSHSN